MTAEIVKPSIITNNNSANSDNSENTPKTAVTFKNVSVRQGEVQILDNISFNVHKGCCFAIIGPNGAGKTTLLKTLLGEIPYTGVINLSKESTGESIRISYVPQRIHLERDFPLTTLELFAIAHAWRPLWTGISKQIQSQALEALSQLKAEHLLNRHIGALSGGERQRVLVALALSRNPELLILDEPEAGVDVSGGQLLCDILDAERRVRGFTQILVSHDLALVRAHANYVACINRHLLAVGPTSQIMSDDILATTFGFHRQLKLNLVASPGDIPETSRCHCSFCENCNNSPTKAQSEDKK